MNFLPIFPTILGINSQIGITNSTIEQYKKYINNLPFYNNDEYSNSTLDQKLLENSLFKDLKNKIIKYSKQYLDNLGHIYEDLQICNSWATKTFKNQPTNFHYHSNSYLSGTYYLTKGSKLLFNHPTLDKWSFNSSKNEKHNAIMWVDPIPGLLVIFPSFLAHKISTHTKDNNRISIAFNIIPKGEFGPPSSKLYL